MVRVETKSTISAPASVLWQIIMEVDKYPQWYSVMLEANGTRRLGARLKFRVKAMDGSPRQFVVRRDRGRVCARATARLDGRDVADFGGSTLF